MNKCFLSRLLFRVSGMKSDAGEAVGAHVREAYFFITGAVFRTPWPVKARRSQSVGSLFQRQLHTRLPLILTASGELTRREGQR